MLSLPIIGMCFGQYIKPPVMQRIIHTERYGSLAVAQPAWNAQGLALIFVDTRKFTPKNLTQPLTNAGITAVVIDLPHLIKHMHNDPLQCVEAKEIRAAIDNLTDILPTPAMDRLMVLGLGDGALIPFMNAQLPSDKTVKNISVGFSTQLPVYINLCPPFTTQYENPSHRLVSSPALQNHWRSVWTYNPTEQTALFVRSLGHVDTQIAAYNLAFDKLLDEEVKKMLGESLKLSLAMPIVEVSTKNPNETVTIFYSGDGGWQDLDKIVANEMAAQNYPVVGVDALRYFWNRVTPEQATADLIETMAYYRKHWGAKSFVLAGFSFGADLLPALYNRLPAADKDSVAQLTLLSLADSTNFEIHVAGWDWGSCR